MRSALLLRLAASLALLACLGHTFLFLTYTPKHGPEEVSVVTAMKSHRFSFSGFQHSYWELYTGYGLFVSISCLMEALILWQLARVPVAKPLVGIFALGETAYAVLMLKFFFLIPIVAHIAIATCLGLALLLGTKSQSTAHLPQARSVSNSF